MRKICILLCLCLLLGGCASDDAYVPTGNGLSDGTTPVTAPGQLDQEPESFALAYYAKDGFNPYLCGGMTNRLVFGLLYQGLFTVDKDYNVEPMLCKSYSVSEDMTTFTFRLESATFSDGTYLKAEDVVASLEAARESDIYKGRFWRIDTIESLSQNSVTITTTVPYENLPILLDIPIVKKDQVGAEMPIGTGPYMLTQAAGSLTLQKRSSWWCGNVQLPLTAQSIPMWAAESAVQIRDWFEFDDLGIAYTDPGSASYVDYRSDYEIWDCETGIFLYLGCNHNRGVFSNSQVRAALTYAIDREKILEECYNDFGKEAVLPASPISPYYDAGLASQITYDPGRLTDVLVEQGLSGSSVVLAVNKSDSVRLKTARLIGDMLTECGLNVTIEDNSTSYFVERLEAGNFDLYIGQTRLSPNMDLSEFYDEVGDLNFGGMENSTCYAMCEEALENSGNYYNLHQMVVRNGGLTPILFRTYAVYMERGLLSKLSPARDNVFWYSSGKSMEEALITEAVD